MKQISGLHSRFFVDARLFREKEDAQMQQAFQKFFPRTTAKLLDEKGQDLVEYGLTMAVIALGSVAGMTAVAQSLNEAFLHAGSVLTTAIS